jgi:hypothetical protein
MLTVTGAGVELLLLPLLAWELPELPQAATARQAAATVDVAARVIPRGRLNMTSSLSSLQMAGLSYSTAKGGRPGVRPVVMIR